MIADELRQFLELQMKNLHAARQQEAAALKALTDYDAEDGEISQLKTLLADAQKRLDERMAADENRKLLQTKFAQASEQKKVLEDSFRASLSQAKLENPDIEAKQIAGVASFKIKEEAVIVDDDKALKLVMDKLWGVPGLLTINTSVLLTMHQNGLLKPEWQRAKHDPLMFAFGAPPPVNPESWYTINQTVTAGIDSDFSQALKKAEQRGDPVNPALLIELPTEEDKSA